MSIKILASLFLQFEKLYQTLKRVIHQVKWVKTTRSHSSSCLINCIKWKENSEAIPEFSFTMGLTPLQDMTSDSKTRLSVIHKGGEGGDIECLQLEVTLYLRYSLRPQNLLEVLKRNLNRKKRYHVTTVGLFKIMYTLTH